jgi:molybdopterin-guanine dinucleotide biosynthesis protein B
VKVFGFAGWSGSGKTTLIERLIPRFAARGLVVSLVKHAHHGFDIDHAGKDSHRHREAGCTEVLVTSAARWALMHELRGAPELTLDAALARLAPCDLVLVEGFKRAPIPKLEVHRAGIGKPWLHPGDPGIVAVASDAPVPGPLPVLAIDDVEGIAEFILAGHWPPAGQGTAAAGVTPNAAP